MASDPRRLKLPGAAAFARQLFGAPTKILSSAPVLSTSRSSVLKNNPNRVAWLIMNRGVTNAAIDIDSSLTFANGTKLGADGGFATMNVAEDGEAVGWEVFGIADVGAPTLRVIEIVVTEAQGERA